MNRRDCIAIFGGVAAAWPIGVIAQPQPARKYRIGILFAGTLASSKNNFHAFFENLASLGYAEGNNLLVERRFADGRIDRLEALAAELVAAKVDLIFAPTG